MSRNRIGVEVDSLPSTQKHEDEPHIDNPRDALGESRSTVSNLSLEAAKAKRQKELLRKKKAERRAHAKQRTAEKQQRQDEKKQKRELQSMMGEDFPAVDPPKVLIDTSTSTQSLIYLEGEHKNGEIESKTHDAATSVPDKDHLTSEDITHNRAVDANIGASDLSEIPRPAQENTVLHSQVPSSQLQTPRHDTYLPSEMVPKNMKGSPLTKNANAAATTIQKALKKKLKQCKTMFRQTPRVFAEEVIDTSRQLPQENTIEVSASPEHTAPVPKPLGPTFDILKLADVQGPDILREDKAASPPSPELIPNSEPNVPPLVLPIKTSGTPPQRPRRSFPSPSTSFSSSCSCSSNPDSLSSYSSCSCSCSSSTSSPSSSSASESERKRKHSQHTRHTSRTARSSRRHRRRSRCHTDKSSHRHSDIGSGPPSALLPSRIKSYGELHHFMATRIQARIRGAGGRAKARQRQIKLDEELKEDALHELQEEAVVKIQTRARGLLVRKKMPVSDTERRRRRRKRSQLGNSNSPTGAPERAQMGIYENPEEIGEWPQEINLELLDDWQELNQPTTTYGDTVTSAEFLSRSQIRVFCGNWNMHAKKPTDDLRLWIRLNKYHIVAVGSEECVNSIAKSVVFTSKKSWEDQLRSTLGRDYILVASHALTAIHNIVFVHSSLLPLLGNIQSDAVATGLGNQLGNKGGVGISFTVGCTSFAFINSHFEAHQRNVAKRNGNFHRINHELKLSPTGALSSPSSFVAVSPTPGGPGLSGLGRTSANRFSIPTVGGSGAGGKRTVSERFDRVFWYGDLNYRINGTRRMVDTLLLRNQHEVLLANDQLQREMKAGNVFAHFREGQLHFRPTYKFDKRSDVYDSSAKQRIPSWTDRVLFLSNDKLHDVELLSYRSQTDFRSSDHRPVCAIFQVNFRASELSASLRPPRPSSSVQDAQTDHATSQTCIIQ
ncbi:unnamed protein product [Phytophthora fragariaefolia]|uniref:Unnamed protein product n=1 Tax=Phytophthora fragariaefolia TaxID=1490495 RepID=A0A9W6TK89_9STRA|nr:unnamed protein product [Phytophthora fragariaefolia]